MSKKVNKNVIVKKDSSSDTSSISDSFSDNDDNELDNIQTDDDNIDDEEDDNEEEVTDTEDVDTDVEPPQLEGDNCLYNYLNNKVDEEKEVKYVTGIDRITKPFLTKYERVRILGTRTTQLAHSAKPMVKGTTGLSSYDIAILELEQRILPFIVYRPLPNGLIEKWKINELL